MKERTKKDLAEISMLRQVIEESQARIRAVEKECQHLDHETALVETLSYEQTPTRRCVVCGARLPGISYNEKVLLWRELYRDLEVELTDEELARVLDGQNL